MSGVDVFYKPQCGIKWNLLKSCRRIFNIQILTENLPPLNYKENGILVGPSVEIVKKIQKRVGSQAQIQVYPWARAYKMALEEKNVILFGTTYMLAENHFLKA